MPRNFSWLWEHISEQNKCDPWSPRSSPAVYYTGRLAAIASSQPWRRGHLRLTSQLYIEGVDCNGILLQCPGLIAMIKPVAPRPADARVFSPVSLTLPLLWPQRLSPLVLEFRALQPWKTSVLHLPEPLANTKPWITVLHGKDYSCEVHVGWPHSQVPS